MKKKEKRRKREREKAFFEIAVGIQEFSEYLEANNESNSWVKLHLVSKALFGINAVVKGANKE